MEFWEWCRGLRHAYRSSGVEEERAKEEQEAKERDIALGNPLLNKQDFNMKRRWDDDVVFKNQARGTEEKGKKKEFVNVSFCVQSASAMTLTGYRICYDQISIDGS